jgi:hypothetical protein
MEKHEDPYEILGIPYDAEEAEIKKAFRKAALKYHPDRQTSEEDKQQAHDIFTKYSDAYGMLSTQNKRSEWRQVVDVPPKGSGKSKTRKLSSPSPASPAVPVTKKKKPTTSRCGPQYVSPRIPSYKTNASPLKTQKRHSIHNPGAPAATPTTFYQTSKAAHSTNTKPPSPEGMNSVRRARSSSPRRHQVDDDATYSSSPSVAATTSIPRSSTHNKKNKRSPVSPPVSTQTKTERVTVSAPTKSQPPRRLSLPVKHEEERSPHVPRHRAKSVSTPRSGVGRDSAPLPIPPTMRAKFFSGFRSLIDEFAKDTRGSAKPIRRGRKLDRRSSTPSSAPQHEQQQSPDQCKEQPPFVRCKSMPPLDANLFDISSDKKKTKTKSKKMKKNPDSKKKQSKKTKAPKMTPDESMTTTPTTPATKDNHGLSGSPKKTTNTSRTLQQLPAGAGGRVPSPTTKTIRRRQ